MYKWKTLGLQWWILLIEWFTNVKPELFDVLHSLMEVKKTETFNVGN